ncbi:MAG: hypothetical protein V2A73_16105 [Pseudomonadota bacterium]
MAKPTELPTWATNGGTDPISGQSNVLEPPDGKQADGFHYLEKPARNWLNWLLNLIYQWCAYLDTFLEDDHTWSGAQTFSDYYHSGRALSLPAAMAEAEVLISGGWLYDYGTATWAATTDSDGHLIFPITLKLGDRINGVGVYVKHGATEGGIWANLYSVDMTTGVRTGQGSDSATGTLTYDMLYVEATVPTVIGAGTKWELDVWCVDTLTSPTRLVLGVEVDYDRPAIGGGP